MHLLKTLLLVVAFTGYTSAQTETSSLSHQDRQSLIVCRHILTNVVNFVREFADQLAEFQTVSELVSMNDDDTAQLKLVNSFLPPPGAPQCQFRLQKHNLVHFRSSILRMKKALRGLLVSANIENPTLQVALRGILSIQSAHIASLRTNAGASMSNSPLPLAMNERMAFNLASRNTEWKSCHDEIAYKRLPTLRLLHIRDRGRLQVFAIGPRLRQSLPEKAWLTAYSAEGNVTSVPFVQKSRTLGSARVPKEANGQDWLVFLTRHQMTGTSEFGLPHIDAADVISGPDIVSYPNYANDQIGDVKAKDAKLSRL